MNPFYIVLFLLIAGSALGLLAYGLALSQRAAVRQRFRSAIGEERGELPTGSAQQSAVTRFLGRFEQVQAPQESGRSEEQVLMQRAGWHSRQIRAAYLGLMYLAPPVLAAIGLLAAITFGPGLTPRGLLWAFFGFMAGYLGPRYLLRWIAAGRQRKLERETALFIRMLAMMLEAGLSLEQAFRNLALDASHVIPEMDRELLWVLRRVDAGEAYTDAISYWARQLDFPDLIDLTGVLREVARFGGNARQPLLELAGIIEARDRAMIKERINKLSVRMTVVMMLLMFPSLLVLIGGPGAMQLMKALGNVAGG